MTKDRKEFWDHKRSEGERIARLEKWEKLGMHKFPEILKHRD